MSVTILLYHLLPYISNHNLLFGQKISEKWTDGMKETIVKEINESLIVIMELNQILL